MTLSRRNVIIGGVAATWIILLILTFLLVRSSQLNTEKAGNQISPTSPVLREATDVEKSNLLYNKSEQERAERDYNAKIGKPATIIEKSPGFTFELLPSLKKTASPTPSKINKVLGVATMCNIDSAPQSVYVYDLKTHWIVEEAANLALEYGVDSPAYALPTDSSTYQYQFTDKNNRAFFTLYEASGVYKYHFANIVNGPIVGEGAMLDKSNATVTYHKLNNKIAPPVSTPASGGSMFYTYKRVLDDFKLTDNTGVRSVATSSICNVPDSAEIGEIDVQVRTDGTLANLLNNTRTILGAYKTNRLSLEDAVTEFATSQPVDPIVIPPSSTVDTGKVVIDSAVLAYYDVGINFGQVLYTPMYITHGTVGGAQVVAFFPAVSATELLKKGLVKIVPRPGNSASQQQGTLGFATPTPYMPPAPPASGPISGPGCPGNMVDYQVMCSFNGRQICIDAYSADSAKDPLSACSSGCKNISGIVTVESSKSPCDSFIQQKNVPASERNFSQPILPGSGVSPGDQVSCAINACPC